MFTSFRSAIEKCGHSIFTHHSHLEYLVAWDMHYRERLSRAAVLAGTRPCQLSLETITGKFGPFEAVTHEPRCRSAFLRRGTNLVAAICLR